MASFRCMVLLLQGVYCYRWWRLDKHSVSDLCFCPLLVFELYGIYKGVIMRIAKEHTGKTIYAIPTGNNARRGIKNQDPQPFEVVSVARKYAKLKNPSGYTDDYDCEIGATKQAVQSGYSGNSGYMWFASLIEVEELNERNRLQDDISAAFRYGPPRHLSFDQVKKIHSILEAAKASQS